MHSPHDEPYEMKDYETLIADNTDQSSLSHHSQEYDSDVRVTSLHRPGYLGFAHLISYILLFLALVFDVCAIIAIILSLREPNNNSGSLFAVASITLISGTCDGNLHTINLGLHLLINVLGTLILGSSNYLQQICTSPELGDLQKEMSAESGDIFFGANSPSRLLRRWSSLTVLWITFILTSVPIHLMLNGSIGYAILTVPIRASTAINTSNFSLAEIPNGWTQITSDRCVQYLLGSISFNTDYTNITVVTTDSASLSDYQQWATGEGVAGVPIPKTSDVVQCFIDPVAVTTCEVTLRWFPLLCTSVALTIKAIVAFFSIRFHSHFRSRIYNSIGDMLVLGAEKKVPMTPDFKVFPGPFHPRKVRWVRALGVEDLLSAAFVWLSAASVLLLGNFYWDGGGLSLSDKFKEFGLGSIDIVFVPGTGPATIYDEEPATFPLQVLVANCPQLWLSIGYLIWNNQVTRIWMEREWRSFYLRRHRPRVSHYSREIGLRPTRWLQLPYWLTGILMALSTTLHWLVSQTMFVVEILTDPTEHALSQFYTNFSPFACLVVGAVATVLILAITIYSFVPIRTSMPLMGGSTRMVIESSRMLTTPFPEKGVAWGDISRSGIPMAGFGEDVGPLVEGTVYVSGKEEGSEVDARRGYSSHSESRPLIS